MFQMSFCTSMLFFVSVHLLTCQTNEIGATPIETKCNATAKFCNYFQYGDEIVIRLCSDESTDTKVACAKWEEDNDGTKVEVTNCYCDTTNCNHKCIAENCKPADPGSVRQLLASNGNANETIPEPERENYEMCKASCSAGDESGKTDKPKDAATEPKGDDPKSETPKTHGGTTKSGCHGLTGSFKSLLATWTAAALLTFISLN